MSFAQVYVHATSPILQRISTRITSDAITSDAITSPLLSSLAPPLPLPLIASIASLFTTRLLVTTKLFTLSHADIAVLRDEREQFAHRCEQACIALDGLLPQSLPSTESDASTTTPAPATPPPPPPTKWWHSLPDEDPLTLEPLSSLPLPPFKLHAHYFDAHALTTYITGRCNFSHPLTRRPLTLADCHDLDRHVTAHYRRQPTVVTAFTVHTSIKLPSTADPSLRAEAALASLSLFDYERGVYGTEGLTVIDDAEATAFGADVSAHDALQESFPALPGHQRLAPVAPVAPLATAFTEIVESAAAAAERESIEREIERELYVVQCANDKIERAAGREEVKLRHARRIVTENAATNARRELEEECRREIEEWRRQVFESGERVTAIEAAPPSAPPPAAPAASIPPVEPTAIPMSQEERDKIKRAKKKEKEKARARKKKEEATLVKAKEAEEERVRIAKEAASMKCEACGTGIVRKKDVFKKGDSVFCSVQCARSG